MEESIKDINNQEEKDDDLSALTLKAEISPAELEIFQEMTKLGIMYGHNKSKTNPKFKPYIFSNRGGVEIIDLAQTSSGISAAADFLREKTQAGGNVLIVATQPAAREAITKLSEKFNFSFINNRWLGGLLTNFRIVSQRIEKYKNTKFGMEKGAFEKYTKKERGVIAKNLEKMERNFSGLENLVKLPEAMFVIDPSAKGHMIAVREAKKMKIPVVAIIDNDDNPDLAEYPIPGNDHAKTSIDWILEKIENQILK